MSNDLKPEIYVACLAAYNDGVLHGAWIDANQAADDIHEEIQSMLSASPIPFAEEWAIHDFSDFGGCHIDESADIESVSSIAAFISEHDKMGAALLKYLDHDLEVAREMMEDHYQGIYDSEADFAEKTMEEIYPIPEYLSYYIDYQKVARDWFMSDYVSLDIGNQVAVFSQ